MTIRNLLLKLRNRNIDIVDNFPIDTPLNIPRLVATATAIITPVVGVVVFLFSTFVDAKDFDILLQNQKQQIELIEKTQKQINFFQIEYYYDKIKNLEKELQMANDPKLQSQLRLRPITAIQSDLDNTKQHLDQLQKLQ